MLERRDVLSQGASVLLCCLLGGDARAPRALAPEGRECIEGAAHEIGFRFLVILVEGLPDFLDWCRAKPLGEGLFLCGEARLQEFEVGGEQVRVREVMLLALEIDHTHICFIFHDVSQLVVQGAVSLELACESDDRMRGPQEQSKRFLQETVR